MLDVPQPLPEATPGELFKEKNRVTGSTIHLLDNFDTISLLFWILGSTDLRTTPLPSPDTLLDILGLGDKYDIPFLAVLVDGWLIAQCAQNPVAVLAVSSRPHNGKYSIPIIRAAIESLCEQPTSSAHPVKWDKDQVKLLGYKAWFILVKAAEEVGYTQSSKKFETEDWPPIANMYIL